MSESENTVLLLLCEIRNEMTTKKELAAVKSDVADVRSDVKSLRSDVASDLLTLEKSLSNRITYLNRAVMDYHSLAMAC
jgi:hypothetical protein